MIPAAFEYRRAKSIDEAARLLGQAGDVKLLAGGHSLIPLMRLRLAQPTMLVDINPLADELGYIRRDNGNLRIGALTRHYQIQQSDEVKRSLPLLAEIANEVYLSVNTVKTHMRHLYSKLGAHGRGQAVQRARALGLLAPSGVRIASRSG